MDVTGSSVWSIVDSIVLQDTKKASESTGSVSSVGDDGTIYVRIDGSTVETPVSGTYSDVKVGDDVKVNVYKGRASIAGNSTSPSVGATFVDESVTPVKKAADTAMDMALAAEADAARAHEAADQAQASAALAHEAADQAQSSADDALESARDANASAIDALTGLSTVEDVVGVVSWAAEHSSYVDTEDAAVVEGKTYYTRSGTGTDENPYVYTKVDNPVDEDIGSYYEYRIDEELASYVMSHLSLTDQGLWVTMDPTFTPTTGAFDTNKTYYVLVDGNYVRVDNPVETDLPNYYERDDGYRVLLSSSGMKVYDGAGHPVATFGENIGFDADRPQHIGGDDAFIEWVDTDNDGVADTLNVVASSITFTGGGLRDELDDVDARIESLTLADATASASIEAVSGRVSENASGIAAAQVAAGAAQATADTAQQSADDVASALQTDKEDRAKYIRFDPDEGTITLGQTGSNISMVLSNDRLKFTDDSGEEVAYASGGEFHAPNMSVNSALKFTGVDQNNAEVGLWAWIPLEDQGLVLKWIG